MMLNVVKEWFRLDGWYNKKWTLGFENIFLASYKIIFIFMIMIIFIHKNDTLQNMADNKG